MRERNAMKAKMSGPVSPSISAVVRNRSASWPTTRSSCAKTASRSVWAKIDPTSVARKAAVLEDQGQEGVCQELCVSGQVLDAGAVLRQEGA